MTPRRAASTAFVCVLAAGCAKAPEDPGPRDRARVIAAYDACMQREGDARGRALETLRRLPVTDQAADEARDACVTMLDSLAAATELSTRLEPMAANLDRYRAEDASVPDAERAAVVRLYQRATRAADTAAASIEPCSLAMERLRARLASGRTP